MRQSKLQYKYSVRRLKKAKDKIQNDKFVNSLLDGGVNIFDEVKKFRGKTKTCSSTIDGHVGSQNIAEHFATVYSNLYSKDELGDEFEDMCTTINEQVGPGSIHDVNLVTVEIVKEAMSHMKDGKKDALYDFSSECFSNAPPDLLQ